MLQDILQQTFLQNRILDYLISLSVFLAGISGIWVLKKVILHRLKMQAEKTATSIDDFLIHIVEKKVLPMLFFGVFYLSIQNLTIGPSLNKVIDALVVTMITILGIRLLVAVIYYAFETYWLKKEEALPQKQDFRRLLPVIKVIIWGVGITFLLDNLGFKISTVIAGLGIGGIAVALAAQAVLGDLFSYFAILIDRPFVTGDFIIIEGYLGTVEHIGIKTTRIRSLGGEQLVFSNTDLTNSRVRNYKKMDRRRVVFQLGVTYETGLQQLKEIPVIITDIIKSINNTVFDRAHFFSYGDFSLTFEVVYNVLSSDYNKYMDIQQEINFAIKDEFEKRGIEFAYPTQTLYLNKT